ncbi:hypothetical protein EBT16_06445 [bacterium]|nr:hypothetical protein [bacterium]
MNDTQLSLSDQTDLNTLVIGGLLGAGCSRRVHIFLPDMSKVVKIQTGPFNFDNVREWDLWLNSENFPLRKWLARCHTISAHGRVLIQERTYPCPDFMLPKEVPAVLGDLKPGNWGFVFRGGKKVLVCHDYANLKTVNPLQTKLKMRKAEWHSLREKGYLEDR